MVAVHTHGPEGSRSAEEVFNHVNFLMLKGTADYLVKLEPAVLEDFVLKYSNVLIFLLNVLDPERSLNLLNRLTDTSILSLLEEELRMLTIREVARMADSPEKFVTLTSFLDLIDSLAGKTSIPEEERPVVRDAIDIMEELSREAGRRRFLYLDYFSTAKINEIFQFNLNHNPPVNFGLMAVSSEQVRESILEITARNSPELLACVPPVLFSIRNYKLFLNESVFAYLPSTVKAIVEEFDSLQHGKEDLATSIRRSLGISEDAVPDLQKVSPAQRNEMLNMVYSRLRMDEKDSREFLLRQLVSDGYLRSEDADLLRTALDGGIDI